MSKPNTAGAAGAGVGGAATGSVAAGGSAAPAAGPAGGAAGADAPAAVPGGYLAGLAPTTAAELATLPITCGICFSILQEPVTLPCKHSACAKCVRQRLESSGAGDGYTCLLCTNHYPNLNAKTVGDYFNKDLAHRVLQLSRGADARPECTWCDKATATVFCPECCYTLCNECNAAVHLMGRKKTHVPITINDSRSIRNAARKCAEKGHEEYKLEFFCLQCEQLCCAYCLQIGPHKMHDNIVVAKAAMDVRNQMGRDLENLGHVKTRLEQQANELNRVNSQYLETYDHVESLIADRFAAFRQQLAQKELDVRKLLAGLREMGDNSLCEARSSFLEKIDQINMAGITYRRLQHGGADYEVLLNRSTVNAFLSLDLQPVTGTGFRLSDLGNVIVSGMEISLDLNARGPEDSSHRSILQPRSMVADPARGVAADRSLSRISGAGAGAAGGAHHGAPGGFRWTFAPDNDVEFRESADGLSCRCLETAESGQIGIRTNESFDNVRSIGGATENNNVVTWRVRLDRVSDTFIGIVDSTVMPGQAPEGFYWRPMKQGQFDGRVGRANHVLKTLNVCRPGDVLKFSYEFSSRSLKLAINNIDRGVIVVDVPATVAPCFIFRPGEAVTLLW
jgi:hypothetical protein